jgi:hypothetical protein
MSLCLINYRSKKVYGDGDIASPFFTMALDGGEWSEVHGPTCFPAVKDPPVKVKS